MPVTKQITRSMMRKWIGRIVPVALIVMTNLNAVINVLDTSPVHSRALTRRALERRIALVECQFVVLQHPRVDINVVQCLIVEIWNRIGGYTSRSKFGKRSRVLCDTCQHIKANQLLSLTSTAKSLRSYTRGIVMVSLSRLLYVKYMRSNVSMHSRMGMTRLRGMGSSLKMPP